MSTTGIYGLSGSGIDVESMVKVGMLSKQSQYDKLYKNEVKNEWTKEAYSSVYSDLQTFKNSTMSGYKMSSKSNPMLTASTTASVATATANADAATMGHTVNVTATAKNAYMLSTSPVTRNNSASDSSIYLKDIIYKKSDANGDLPSLTTMEASYKTMSDDQKKQVALSFTISDSGSGQAGADAKEITFTYDDLFGNNETLNDLASKIRDSGSNITAQYDATNSAFTLYNKSGGSAGQINLSVTNRTASSTANNVTTTATADDTARELLNNLHLGDVNHVVTAAEAAADTTGTLKEGAAALGPAATFSATDTTPVSVTGTDAAVVIDGKSYTTASNKISVSNVTYTLTAVGTTTVSVSQDTDTLIANVKQFVADYNKMLDELNTKYNETQYSGYGVLTQSQESSMTADQVTKWNEKAKSGLLYHNRTIGDLISSMRESIYTPVSSVQSKYNNMMAIGVSSSTDQGHLKLDEDQLKTALAADPDCVYQLFTSSGDVTKNGDTTTDFKQQGVAGRIYDSVGTYMSQMQTYAGTSSETSDGSTLGTLILDLKTKMSDFKTQMDAYEDKLFTQYDAMEVAIQKMSSSMNYVTGNNG